MAWGSSLPVGRSCAVSRCADFPLYAATRPSLPGASLGRVLPQQWDWPGLSWFPTSSSWAPPWWGLLTRQAFRWGGASGGGRSPGAFEQKSNLGTHGQAVPFEQWGDAAA